MEKKKKTKKTKCPQCGFIAKSPQGLAIHTIKKHKEIKEKKKKGTKKKAKKRQNLPAQIELLNPIDPSGGIDIPITIRIVIEVSKVEVV